MNITINSSKEDIANWLTTVIQSCVTLEQIDVAIKLYNNTFNQGKLINSKQLYQLNQIMFKQIDTIRESNVK